MAQTQKLYFASYCFFCILFLSISPWIIQFHFPLLDVDYFRPGLNQEFTYKKAN
jgi:hypothetical protein